MWKKIKCWAGEAAYKYFYKADGTMDGSHVAVFVCFMVGIAFMAIATAVDVYLVVIGKSWANYKEVTTWSITLSGGGVGGQIVKSVNAAITETAQNIFKYREDSRFNTKVGEPVPKQGGETPCP